MELDLNNFQSKFKTVMSICVYLISRFDDGRKIRLLAYLDLVKSNKAKGEIIKAHKR